MAMLFDPAVRETGVLVYDRADPASVPEILGGDVMATDIGVDKLVRWVVYSRGDSRDGGSQFSLAMHIIPAGEEHIFAGPALLAGKRGGNDRDLDLDLLWPCFEFRWLGGADVGATFRLGQNYVG
ncbi:hypothetical protein U1839_19050 [Sphingomonas sp. RT2P30]|uniref:hypothetical protein n=1 Tax=Parasphingomonas halimpatiens TaxID=3096162 RepID=UPI002FCC7436